MVVGLPGKINSGTPNEAVNMIGAFPDLKDPVTSQPQSREANLLLISEHLCRQNPSGNRRVAIRIHNEG
jgi:hypothetical protein